MASGKQFSLDLTVLVQKTKGTMDRVVRKVVLDIGSRIVLRTPVGDGKYWKSPPPRGYIGGRARANWQYGEGVVPQGFTAAVDKTGGVSLGNIAKIKSDAAGKIHYLTNNLPYAQRLENGWSRQAPHGMVGLAVTEFQSVVRNAAAEISK